MQPYFAEQCSTSEKTSQWAEKDRLHCIEGHSVTTPYLEVAEHHFEMQNLCKGIYSYCLAHFKSAGSWYTNVQSVNYEQRLRFEVSMFLEWTAIHFSLKSGMASPARAAVLNATLSFGGKQRGTHSPQKHVMPKVSHIRFLSFNEATPSWKTNVFSVTLCVHYVPQKSQ